MKRLLFTLLLALPLLVSAQTAPDPARQIIVLTNQLNALRAQLFPAEDDFAFSRDLSAGQRNDGDVRRLQQLLASLGLFSDALAAGNFGPVTKAAVQSYQAARGISRTGYVGPLTRAALNREPSLYYRIRPRPQYDLAALARSIQSGINAERRTRGLNELAWDDRIAEVARLHSEDQARDNTELTDPNLLCVYPLIRHENFSGQFKAGDRLRAANISYRLAGENIISFSFAESVLYRSSDGKDIACPASREFTPAAGTAEDRRTLFDAIVAERLAAARGSAVAVWINKDWMTPEQVARKAVSGWMNSPDHRQNILTPEFTRGGIGIAIVNEFLIITHNLLAP